MNFRIQIYIPVNLDSDLTNISRGHRCHPAWLKFFENFIRDAELNNVNKSDLNAAMKIELGKCNASLIDDYGYLEFETENDATEFVLRWL